jgi:dTDP-4-amino-4,6-dideoxygalactose transaminase
MPKIMALAEKHGIPVIEDCSQTHGSEINGRKVGSFGDIAAFSTMFGKHICTGGQGGVVFTRNEELYWKIRRAADRGKPFNIDNSNGNVFAALNCNMSELEAAIGRAQLKKLDGIIARRTNVAKMIAKGLAGSKSIIVPELPSGVKHSYWWWRLKINLDVLPARDKIAFLGAVAAEGVSLMDDYSFAVPSTFDWYTKRCAFGSSHYPWCASEYKGDANRQFPLPNTWQTMAEHFNLVIHESWGEAEANATVEAFLKVEQVMCKECR